MQAPRIPGEDGPLQRSRLTLSEPRLPPGFLPRPTMHKPLSPYPRQVSTPRPRRWPPRPPSPTRSSKSCTPGRPLGPSLMPPTSPRRRRPCRESPTLARGANPHLLRRRAGFRAQRLRVHPSRQPCTRPPRRPPRNRPLLRVRMVAAVRRCRADLRRARRLPPPRIRPWILPGGEARMAARLCRARLPPPRRRGIPSARGRVGMPRQPSLRGRLHRSVLEMLRRRRPRPRYRIPHRPLRRIPPRPRPHAHRRRRKRLARKSSLLLRGLQEGPYMDRLGFSQPCLREGLRLSRTQSRWTPQRGEGLVLGCCLWMMRRMPAWRARVRSMGALLGRERRTMVRRRPLQWLLYQVENSQLPITPPRSQWWSYTTSHLASIPCSGNGSHVQELLLRAQRSRRQMNFFAQGGL